MTAQVLEYWQAGGPLLIPIAAVCMAMWAYFLRAHQRLTAASLPPPGLDAAMARIGDGSDWAAALHELSPSPRLLRTGVAETILAVTRGQPADATFQNWQAEQEDQLQRDFMIISALAAAAPLLGLLGTVVGMIGTFNAVAASAGGTAGKVASGISQALITTQFGLVVAIPAVFGLARLQRMLTRVRAAMGECRTHILMALEQREQRAA